jgi:hypothetical protein
MRCILLQDARVHPTAIHRGSIDLEEVEPAGESVPQGRPKRRASSDFRRGHLQRWSGGTSRSACSI